MINHLLRCWPEVCQERTSRVPQEAAAVDQGLMREWALHICIKSLRPVGMIADPDVRAVLAGRLRGLGGKQVLQAEVDDVIVGIRLEVLEQIRVAIRERARFTISGDCWKPKMKRKAHFLRPPANPVLGLISPRPLLSSASCPSPKHPVLPSTASRGTLSGPPSEPPPGLLLRLGPLLGRLRSPGFACRFSRWRPVALVRPSGARGS
jgi:hypothetical protein